MASAPSTKPIRTLIADGQRLVLAGLRRVIEGIPGVEVVGETSVAGEVVPMACSLLPDVVLIDSVMRGFDCTDLVARLASEVPGCRVLVVSGQGDDEFVRRALRAGASGYILKSSTTRDLRTAIEEVAAGNAYLCPGAWSSAVCDMQRGREGDAPRETLSPRQREILTLIAQGHCTKGIATAIGISVKTVETHRAALMDRLHIRHVAGLVMYALRHDLVRLDAS
jgi:DNA-binding NarL/FixJ family response regulator